MLDESVWEEVSHRLQDPNLVLEAYQQHQAKRRESTQDEPEDATRRLDAQIKSANRELSRLLDAYQGGAIELTELQKRRRLNLKAVPPCCTSSSTSAHHGMHQPMPRRSSRATKFRNGRIGAA